MLGRGRPLQPAVYFKQYHYDRPTHHGKSSTLHFGHFAVLRVLRVFVMSCVYVYVFVWGVV
jgi:hypothetical protein